VDLDLIHRYWTGPDEPPVQELPGQRIWHDDDLPPELRLWIGQRHHQVAPGDRPRHRSNCVRWWLLAHHGGLWLDHDATLHADPPAGEWVAAVGRHPEACVMRLRAGHPLAWAMLDHIERAPARARRAPQVSGQWPLAFHARRLRVRLEQIPRPGQPATWIRHAWATSAAASKG
jgi:hypothetical protein